jgi:iron complex outermembrane receptor protein
MKLRILTMALVVAYLSPTLAQTSPQSAAAQSDDGSAGGQTLETVVVTGTRERAYRPTVATTANKTEAAIKEVPFSVQVVSRELLEDRGVQNFGEAIRTVPGVSPQTGWGGTNYRYRIRGFTTANNLKNGYRRSAFTPIDDFANIEQIEILKGPASALYGRFEPGGVVNLVTKRPLAKPLASFDVTAGSFDFRRTSLDLSQPLGDAAGLRINAAYEQGDSHRDFVDQRTSFVAPVLVWRLGADTLLTAELEAARRKGSFDRGFGNGAIFLTLPIERNYAEPYTRADNESVMGLLELEHRFSGAWSGKLGYMRSRSSTDSFFYAYGFPVISNSSLPTATVNRRPTISDDRQTAQTLQAELIGQLDWGGLKQRVLLGVEWGREKWNFDAYRAANVPISLHNPVYGNIPPTFNFNTPWGNGYYGDRTVALYAQSEVALSDQWKLLVGLRHDRADGEALDVTFNGPAAQARKVDATSPRLGLTWTPADAVSLYASWARSFRTELDSGLLQDGRIPKPSRGEQAEVGAKFSLLQGRLTPTIALFDIRRKDGTTPDPNGGNFVTQVGEQRSRGVEIDIPFMISRQWRVLASATYMDAEITADTTTPVGNRLNNAPRKSGALWTTYDFSGPLQGMSAGLGVIGMGARAANNANSFFLPSYWRTDLNLGWRGKFGGREWRAQLNVLNATDERYFDSGGNFVPLYPQAPRTVNMTVGVKL